MLLPAATMPVPVATLAGRVSPTSYQRRGRQPVRVAQNPLKPKPHTKLPRNCASLAVAGSQGMEGAKVLPLCRPKPAHRSPRACCHQHSTPGADVSTTPRGS
eukprot:SAG11_NODE_1823_length_4206_cov_11.545654_2_plen_102_part_00